MREWSAKLRGLADRQAGRVAWWQLTALDLDAKTIGRLVAGGYLAQVLPRVYAVGHGAPSIEADVWAAVLYTGPGARLSDATALWWHGLLDRRPWPLQVTTPRRCRSIKGIRVFGRRAHRRIMHEGLPTTTIEQAMLDFAAQAARRRL
jgi:predicted transcriptional regulator of viral defense system